MRTFALLAVAASLAGCSAGAPDSGNARSELEAANAAYDQALIDGDAAALDKYYTADFQIIDDDGAIHDRQNQIDFMTKKVDLLIAKGDDVKVTMLGGDAALVTGRFTGRYRMDGKENDFTERYSSVWVRDGGQWKVRHEHTSMVPKKETPAAE